jgi:hypothetical protein
LNAVIVLLGLLVLFLGYGFVSRVLLRPPVESGRAQGSPSGVIQVDVLNGCGAAGSAVAVTNYLRARGFDVVEMRNYKTFDVPESMVIDRTGDRANAERVAYALGIRADNILQQINQDYYVDVSVLIGRDYPALKPSH